MRFLIKIFLFLFITNVSYSQYSYENIPQITIQAFRTAEKHLPLTYSYDVIEPNNLKSLTSTNIVQYGPKGQFSSTFTRGTNSNHTLFTLNGIPIKDSSTPTGNDDISQHNFLGVQSLEVIKGPMSNIYGPDAIGGVVNMKTQANDKNSIDISYGSNNTKTQTIKLGKKIDNHIIDLQIENETSDGISVYPKGNEKDSFRTRNYILQTDSRLVDDWFLKTNFIDKTNKTNLDDSGADNTNYTGLWNFKNQQLSLQKNNDFEFTLNNSDHDRTYNKSGVIDKYESNTKTLLAKNTFHTIADISLGTEHTFTNAKFNTNIDYYVSSVNKKRENHGYYFNISKFLSEELLVTGGIRYDMPSNFENQFTQRAGLFYNGFRTSISTGYKMPTLYEMYGKDNYGYLGNPNLIPEKSISFEVGYGNKNIDIALFQNKIDNLLIYKNNTYKNDNSTSVRKGIETNLKHNILDLNLKNSTTFLIAEDSKGNELLRRPKWVNNLEVSYNEIKNTSLKANWNYYGSHIDIDSVTYNNKNMPPVSTFDLSADYIINNTIFYGKLNNLTDVKYERPDGYNQLSRNFIIGLKQNF